jgi:hypothetical protein
MEEKKKCGETSNTIRGIWKEEAQEAAFRRTISIAQLMTVLERVYSEYLILPK